MNNDVGKDANFNDKTKTVNKLVINPAALKKKRSIWNRDEQSARRQAGVEYVGTKKVDNQVVQVIKPAKTIKNGCNADSKCRKIEFFKCALFTTAIKAKLLEQYLKMTEPNRLKFLLDHINSTGNSNIIEGEKKDFRQYFLPIGTNKVRVCAQLFRDTLSLSKTYICGLFKKPLPCAAQRPIVVRENQQMEKTLQDFFNSLPLMPSHYNRENSNKKYIQRDIESVTTLYSEYKAQQEGKSAQYCQKTKFREAFEKTNIAIFKPIKDRCEKCQTFENMKGGLTHPQFINHRKEVSHRFIFILLQLS